MVKYNTGYNTDYNTIFEIVYINLHRKNIVAIEEYVHHKRINFYFYIFFSYCYT